VKKWHVVATLVGILVIAGLAFVSVRPTVQTEATPSFDDATMRMRIDISERKLYIEENGDQVASYSVAVGTGAHPTPRGAFTVQRVIWNPRWVPPEAKWAEDERPREPGDPKNPMGRVKIFFREPDYYLHGTNAEASIGTAASHGCVRMLNGDVIEVARLLMDHGDAPIEPGLIQRLINRVRQTKDVRLARAIPLRVQS
jgi:lipoprotein-anchoring transpeptidase ErfK/SrfK